MPAAGRPSPEWSPATAYSADAVSRISDSIGLLLAVANPVDGAVEFVGHQQRAVGQLQDVDRPAPERVGLVVQEARHERRDGRLAVGGGFRRHYVVAGLLVAVPGAAPRDEGHVLVLCR